MYKFRLPEFEGPLDLLLQLIEHRELDITRVSLGAVADQYLDLITSPGAIELSALADYLVIAAKLILIKSRLLLPQPESVAPEAEEDLGDALARQLREYKLFKKAAAFLRERQQKGLRAFPRFAPPPRPQPAPRRLDGVTPEDLVNALQRALRIRPSLPQGTLNVPLSVSIDQQIQVILSLAARGVRLSFNQLLARAATRVEIIVTFLAVLELIKRRQIYARQEQLFGDIQLVQREDSPLAPDRGETDADWDYTTD
jgi:segregation and condensation protein A